MSWKNKIFITLVLFFGLQFLSITQLIKYPGEFCEKEVKTSYNLVHAAGLFNKDNLDQRTISCVGNKCVVVEKKWIGEVMLCVDKRFYRGALKRKGDYIYGESIHFVIQNNSQKNIFFNTELVIPFTTLYVENFKNGKWRFYRNLHGTAELPLNYSSNEWQENAVCLKPGRKYTSKYKINYSADADINIEGRYRLKLEYCNKLREKDDWLLRENVIGEKTRKYIFKEVYSEEFKIE